MPISSRSISRRSSRLFLPFGAPQVMQLQSRAAGSDLLVGVTLRRIRPGRKRQPHRRVGVTLRTSQQSPLLINPDNQLQHLTLLLNLLRMHHG